MLRAVILGFAVVTASMNLAFGDDVLTCVSYPLEAPDEEGFALYAIERCPISGGVPDCFGCYFDMDIFHVNDANWPESCPDCFSARGRRRTAFDRPLRRRIGTSQSLVDYLSRTTTTTKGQTVSLSRRIRQVTARDVQVQANGRTISARLFDMTYLDAKERVRVVRFGLESERPVQPGLRVIHAEPSLEASYKLSLIDRGRRYPVKTQASLRDSELAAAP